MGRVYEAFDAVTQEKVAIKTLRQELAQDAVLLRRFRREASVLETLQHPNCVKVLYVHRGHPPFFVMEYVDAPSLQTQVVAYGAMPATSVIKIARAMLDVLELLHESGIVHGDIKPDNILMSEPVKLVDFGLAKLDGMPRLTRTGHFAGTVMYTAPELLTGETPPGLACDIYALGATLYFAYQNRAPFVFHKHPGAQMMEVARGQTMPLVAQSTTEDDALLLSAIPKFMARSVSVRPSSVVSARELLTQGGHV